LPPYLGLILIYSKKTQRHRIKKWSADRKTWSENRHTAGNRETWGSI